MIGRRTDAGGRARRLAMIIRRCRTLTAVRVVEHLARLEAKHELVTPSRAGIARAIGRSERSVSRAVGELEAAGALDVWRDRPYAVDGKWCRRRTSLYRLKWPPKVAKHQRDKRGHALPVYAFHEAIEPVDGATKPAPTSTDGPAATLFDPAQVEARSPADEPAPPPWITEGIDRKEWIRRCRT